MTPAERSQAVLANLGLAYFHARRYRRLCRRRWVDWDDVVQEATLGLFRAVEGHDPAKGSLSYYAHFWVRLHAANVLLAARAPLRVPTHRRDQGIPTGNDGLLSELVASYEDSDPDHDAWREQLERVWAAVDRLPGNEAMVLRLRYDEGLLQREIAARLGRTTTRVCQIEQRAIERLRQRLVG